MVYEMNFFRIKIIIIIIYLSVAKLSLSGDKYLIKYVKKTKMYNSAVSQTNQRLSFVIEKVIIFWVF